MASLVTHPVVPLALAAALGRKSIPYSALALGIILSMVPDADVIAFRFGIPYGHMLGHRGFTHSLLFAAAIALALTLLPAYRAMRVRIFIFFVISAASHGLLDAMTSGGKGVGFFIPFSGERYFFAARPIVVSPLTVSGFFSARGIRILQSEIIWVWLPCAVLALTGIVLRRIRARV